MFEETSSRYYGLVAESAPTAQEVVDAVCAAFPAQDAYPQPDQIESVMRPFFPVSHAVEKQIEALLIQQRRSSIRLRLSSWFEANDVVSGHGEHVERRIQFLLMDTCTCVLDHLPEAVRHATGEIDPRVLRLLEHEYLRDKR